MNPASMRLASAALGLIAGVGQLVIALLGDAIGGMSLVIVLLGVDAIIALAGAALILRWTLPGIVLLIGAGLGALAALFSTTLLEIGVVLLLLGAAAAALPSVRKNPVDNI